LGEDCNRFILEQENLESILNKIPDETRIAVVSVVGAFRTGKSFLLNFFLRYLRDASGDKNESFSDSTQYLGGGQNHEDSQADGGSFQWRGGSDRHTTGIWMWSEPFVRVDRDSCPVAILLMDTQGMFDNETTMTLTAQIFGISTMISSFQIYNVDKRIQEDNLQHLALFSEYGRMALRPHISSNADIGKEVKSASSKPFQHLQFLVRDWQNFDGDWDEKTSQSDQDETYKELRRSMETYLLSVIKDRDVADLQSTRRQISRCFEEIDCYLLPFPGTHVTRKNYDGSVGKIDFFFRSLLDRYVRMIFEDKLEAKRINQRYITGHELLSFFDAYVKMFQEGSNTFPKAMTMLDATAEANNRNALAMAISKYKKGMSEIAGISSPFVKESMLLERHLLLEKEAIDVFSEVATMGSEENISDYRSQLVEGILTEKDNFFAANTLRNPFRNVELYVVPLIVALVAYMGGILINLTCSHHVCDHVHMSLRKLSFLIAFVMLALTWRYIQGAFAYMKDVVPMVLEPHLKSS
jgi:atlastin